mmetsp:Transcript_10853/g.33630  ORF Transcript_10853/g.33630 Transcript_10853/m.33630 type:complete len:226 (+) Transcript_10853:86-763(+)
MVKRSMQATSRLLPTACCPMLSLPRTSHTLRASMTEAGRRPREAPPQLVMRPPRSLARHKRACHPIPGVVAPTRLARLQPSRRVLPNLPALGLRWILRPQRTCRVPPRRCHPILMSGTVAPTPLAGRPRRVHRSISHFSPRRLRAHPVSGWRHKPKDAHRRRRRRTDPHVRRTTPDDVHATCWPLAAAKCERAMRMTCRSTLTTTVFTASARQGWVGLSAGNDAL